VIGVIVFDTFILLLTYRVPKYPAEVADASTAKLTNIIPNNDGIRPRRQLARVDVLCFEFFWAREIIGRLLS
jgi:hypothetical protein